jgi:putative endonuclease
MAPARFIAEAFRQWLKPASSEPEHLRLGRWGEKIAAKHLRLCGYKILRKNFRAPGGGEVDLVCRHGKFLVFVEVKTRTSEDFGRPIDAVNLKKQRLIIRGALKWLHLLDRPEISFRFDVVEVVMFPDREIRVIENAFQLPENYL